MAAIGKSESIGVVGAGTMGAGIAQVAAAAGHPVILYDAMAGAAARGKERLRVDLEKLVARGRTSQEGADALLDRIVLADNLESLSPAALVVEAIVENLQVKRELFARLEAIVRPQGILATNTSSISATSIARDLNFPSRFVGMHFFNPAPIMKLVEVVSGIATAQENADTVFATAEAWGKVPIHAKSTPGFIVNRVARSYYAEALRLYEEQVADPATLDALMTEGGGFRMGPFALMDLIGHDVNYEVSMSVFNAYYQEPRFRPSIVQLELVNAGRLGRKTGRGFYDYGKDAVQPTPTAHKIPEGTAPFPGFSVDIPFKALDVHILPTDGQTAHDRATSLSGPVILYDLADRSSGASRIGFTASLDVPTETVERFAATMKAMGLEPTRLPDWPGLVVMRTVAMLANEAFEAVLHGVADEAGVDTAMRFGVNYPKGPIGWAREIGLARVLCVIDNLRTLTGDPRYRASLAMRMAAKTDRAEVL
ncbi:3-hydroxyacyl-CoA dehydrogenase NAD-binding domain-containing protein [Mesorhizobium sp. A556]